MGGQVNSKDDLDKLVQGDTIMTRMYSSIDYKDGDILAYAIMNNDKECLELIQRRSLGADYIMSYIIKKNDRISLECAGRLVFDGDAAQYTQYYPDDTHHKEYLERNSVLDKAGFKKIGVCVISFG